VCWQGQSLEREPAYRNNYQPCSSSLEE
jgi:hypothetical protein